MVEQTDARSVDTMDETLGRYWASTTVGSMVEMSVVRSVDLMDGTSDY